VQSNDQEVRSHIETLTTSSSPSLLSLQVLEGPWVIQESTLMFDRIGSKKSNTKNNLYQNIKAYVK